MFFFVEIFSGIMASSAKYFCCYCDVSRDNIERVGEARCVANLRKNFEEWRDETKSDKKKSILYKSTANNPLIEFEENTAIVHFIPPPELHMFIGITSYLYFKMELETPEVADAWMTSCSFKTFHGQKLFNGNNSKKMLENVEKLSELSPSK